MATFRRSCLFALAALAACPSQSSKTTEKPKVQQLYLPIVHGAADTDPTHNAVVALFNADQGFFCSGTLIAPRVVLTAGHCVREVSQVGLKVGFGSDINSADMVFVKGVESLAAPNFDSNALTGDIGVVRLAGPAPVGVTPIPFLPASKALTAADVGTQVQFVGFGNDENGNFGVKLQVSDLLDLVCESAGGCDFAGSSTPDHVVCYDQEPGGPCSGDSGGPAFLTLGGVQYVAAATSFGDQQCASSGCSTSAWDYEAFINAFIGVTGFKGDGQGCAAGAECQSGFCFDTVCCQVACDNAAGCTACSAAKGASADGVCSPITHPCDDGDKCTVSDTCSAGRCVGTPLACPAPDACHLYASCNPATGKCDAPAAKPDGVPCDDKDECTLVDSCQKGVCTGTARTICPSADPCMQDAKCENKKCGASLPKADGEGCDDGNACTDHDACTAGVCAGGPAKVCPPTLCHGYGRCDPKSGACIEGVALTDGAGCDDGNACTEKDACKAGACVGTLLAADAACAAPDDCHKEGKCSADGACQNDPVDDGTACIGSELCSVGGTCAAGACLGATPKDCTPPPCFTGDTCDAATGKCQWTFMAAGSACEDGNLCTLNGKCDERGHCLGDLLECPAPEECFRPGNCVPKIGQCSYNWVDDGTACTNGTCKSGECKKEKGVGCSTTGEPMSLMFALMALGGLLRRSQRK